MAEIESLVSGVWIKKSHTPILYTNTDVQEKKKKENQLRTIPTVLKISQCCLFGVGWE